MAEWNFYVASSDADALSIDDRPMYGSGNQASSVGAMCRKARISFNDRRRRSINHVTSTH